MAKTNIQVLGPGCAKCHALAEHAERAARELGLDYELEKVTELDRILAFGVVATPALAVDGEIRVSGHVPTAAKLKTVLANPGANAS